MDNTGRVRLSSIVGRGPQGAEKHSEVWGERILEDEATTFG